MHARVAIIGGGPAGLSAALYLARANIKPIVFAGSPPGGQLMLTSEVENFPGLPSIQGPDLVMNMRKQAESFGAQIIDINIAEAKFKTKPYTLCTEASDDDSIVSADAMLIATGAKALWLGLQNETRLRGHGVSACATCDGFFFKNKTVAVIGGGDTAFEEAMYLTHFTSKVYLIHRGATFRASKIMQDRVFANSKIEIILNAQVKDIIGEQKVTGILLDLSDRGISQSKTLQLEGVFIAIGHQPDTDLFKGQIQVDPKGYIYTLSTLAESCFRENISFTDEKIKDFYKSAAMFNTSTSKAGIFAAGDCIDRHYRQACTAAGMGVAASLDIEKYLQ